MGSVYDPSTNTNAEEKFSRTEVRLDTALTSGDALTLSLIREQASFEPGQIQTTVLWWQSERTGQQSLAEFLAEHGVFSRAAVRTVELIVKGYLQSNAVIDLFVPEGLTVLARELAARPQLTAGKTLSDVATRNAQSEAVEFPSSLGDADKSRTLSGQGGERIDVQDTSAQPSVAPLIRAKAALPDAESLIGQTLGHYHVIQLLGRGAKGLVYEATDVLLNRPVALKVLAPEIFSSDATAVRRFLLEARTASRLNHPNCVGVYGVGKDAGRVWLAMMLVRGTSAQDRLCGGQRLPVAEATRVVEHAARGLHAAHTAGIIHRDIKPGNILLGEAGEVRITDFGMAKAADDALGGLTEPGRWLGTPHFMSPEQCQGHPVDIRADLYSLGATYYNLLTGRPPFADHSLLAVLYKQISEPHPDPRTWVPDLPDEAVAVIDRAMSKDPADRFADAAEMAAALREVRRRILLSDRCVLARSGSPSSVPGEPVFQTQPDTSESTTEEGPSTRVSKAFAQLANPPDLQPTTPITLPSIGSTLGRCQLQAEIGRGATAVVFRARHVSLDIPVAVKVLLNAGSGQTGSALREMLAREARLLARLNHPNIVRVLDFDELAEQPFLVMEFVEGDSLKQLLARRGRLGISESVELTLAVAEALAHADRLGILHRDVKPSNILLDALGVPKLADLGLAQLASPTPLPAPVSANWWDSVHRRRAVVGTPAYMSPEQAVGAQTLDRRSDIYSLGVTLFQMLTGRLPFEGADTVEMMKLRVKSDPISPAEVRAECGPELSAIVLRMLARRPADRYGSYEQLLDALEGLSLRSVGTGEHRTLTPPVLISTTTDSADFLAENTGPTQPSSSNTSSCNGWKLGSFLRSVLGRQTLTPPASRSEPFPPTDTQR